MKIIKSELNPERLWHLEDDTLVFTLSNGNTLTLYANGIGGWEQAHTVKISKTNNPLRISHLLAYGELIDALVESSFLHMALTESEKTSLKHITLDDVCAIASTQGIDPDIVKMRRQNDENA